MNCHSPPHHPSSFLPAIHCSLSLPSPCRPPTSPCCSISPSLPHLPVPPIHPASSGFSVPLPAIPRCSPPVSSSYASTHSPPYGQLLVGLEGDVGLLSLVSHCWPPVSRPHHSPPCCQLLFTPCIVLIHWHPQSILQAAACRAGGGCGVVVVMGVVVVSDVA
jgi:hypothetical protein